MFPVNLFGAYFYHEYRRLFYKANVNFHIISAEAKLLSFYDQSNQSVTKSITCERPRIIKAHNLPGFKARFFLIWLLTYCDFRQQTLSALRDRFRFRFFRFQSHLEINIFKDIAEGQVYLHHHSQVRVIHYDVQPSNVSLHNDMTALVSDFKFARFKVSYDSQRSKRGVPMLELAFTRDKM